MVTVRQLYLVDRFSKLWVEYFLVFLILIERKSIFVWTRLCVVSAKIHKCFVYFFLAAANRERSTATAVSTVRRGELAVKVGIQFKTGRGD